MIAYILPTRNRPEVLARTLAALGALPAHDAEVIIADNAGAPPARAPFELPNGLPVTLTLRPRNEGAAARNHAATLADPTRQWLVMLDDDSHPLDLTFLEALREQPEDVAAVCAEIFLPAPSDLHASTPPRLLSSLRHESGGLPEVPIGCGVACRRDAFLSAGGYDPGFGFYAEEYDLAARLISRGHRIVLDRRFRVLHEKTPAGRSMDAILARLVRNNAWVMQRYAPANARRAELRRTITRYARIAMKEHAQLGYLKGLAHVALTHHRQPRRPLDPEHWDRFTGASACRAALERHHAQRRFTTAAIVAPGKNEHVVRACLAELGVRILPDPAGAEALVIGTLSPGPILDALASQSSDPRILAPWLIAPARPTPKSVAA